MFRLAIEFDCSVSRPVLVMGQYYRLINLSKSQRLPEICGKAIEIIPNIYDYDATEGTSCLMLLLLDLGTNEMTLQNSCLKYLCENKQDYSLGSLPAHLRRDLEVAFLSQTGVGAWSGDRLVLIGDESKNSPCPPDGEIKEGTIYDMEFPSCREPTLSYDHRSKLQEFCKGKDYKIVNLDKKEYLNPIAYEKLEEEKRKLKLEKSEEKECAASNSDSGSEEEKEEEDSTVLDYADNKHGVVTELIIRLVYSTFRQFGDLKPSVTSQGTWAGDRITVCTPDQLEDFEGYRDVSNPHNVELARREDCSCKS